MIPIRFKFVWIEGMEIVCIQIDRFEVIDHLASSNVALVALLNVTVVDTAEKKVGTDNERLDVKKIEFQWAGRRMKVALVLILKTGTRQLLNPTEICLAQSDHTGIVSSNLEDGDFFRGQFVDEILQT